MEKKIRGKNFAKASVINIVKFKIKWGARVVWYCINKPIEILLKWV